MREFFVPGRIEVLGKHTDYAGGRSLLCAVDRGISLQVAPRQDDIVSVADTAHGLACAYAIREDIEVPTAEWTTYVATVIRRIARNFPLAKTGADIEFASTLPAASGLASSSALVTAMYLALDAVNCLTDAAAATGELTSRLELAGYLGAVENGSAFGSLEGDVGVGVFGGSEDHTAILCSRAGCLGQFAFGPVRFEREVVLPPALSFVVAYSGVSAHKAGAARDAYNAASLDTRRILQLWNDATGRSDATLMAALDSSPDAAARVRVLIDGAPGSTSARSLVDRLDQFTAESIDIIPAATAALARGEMAAFGELVDRSQRGAESLLKNQIPETIALARLAREHNAIAASAFGAGFGGSVWALVPALNAAAFEDEWRQSYARAFPQAAKSAVFFQTLPSDGAHERSPGPR